MISRQLSNPFLAPDFSAAAQRTTPKTRRLEGWELLEPLFRSFERAATGAPACMALPEPRPVPTPPGRELMPHQAQVVTATADGHRTFLLADEPGPRQDRPGAARRPGGRRVPAAGRRAQRGQDQLGARGRAVDPVATLHRGARRRRPDGRVRGRRDRELRAPRPARRLAGRPRVPRDGRRRGALHQEQVVAAVPARARAVRADPRAHGAAAAHGAHGHPADQRHRGLPRHLAVPRAGSTTRSRSAPCRPRSRRPG